MDSTYSARTCHRNYKSAHVSMLVRINRHMKHESAHLGSPLLLCLKLGKDEVGVGGGAGTRAERVSDVVWYGCVGNVEWRCCGQSGGGNLRRVIAVRLTS